MTLTTVATFILLTFTAMASADDCKGNICIGSLVIDSSDNVGKVISFPDNNTAQYSVGSYTYAVELARLKVEVPEYNGISRNVEIVDSSNNVGVASHVFEDGRVEYNVGNYTYVSKHVVAETNQFNGCDITNGRIADLVAAGMRRKVACRPRTFRRTAGGTGRRPAHCCPGDIWRFRPGIATEEVVGRRPCAWRVRG